MKIETKKHFSTAIKEYPWVLRDLVAAKPNADILELGGGRKPSFAIADMPDTIASYTVNDISADELALAPAGYRKACFDVSGDASNFEGRYDVVFSRFLAEHVADGLALHRNVHRVLKPGGVAFHLIPTLYASPFVFNRLVPEAATQRLLWALRPHRRSRDPKFPAYYSYCHGDTKKMRRTFAEIGYRDLSVREFFGHPYYDKVPVLRGIDNMAAALAARNDWSWYSSFAYLVARK